MESSIYEFMGITENDADIGMDGHQHHHSGHDKSDTVAQQWINFGMRLGVSSALHPFEYAKVLIQLGHEPLAPVAGRTIFGRPVLVLPNIFRYGE